MSRSDWSCYVSRYTRYFAYPVYNGWCLLRKLLMHINTCSFYSYIYIYWMFRTKIRYSVDSDFFFIYLLLRNIGRQEPLSFICRNTLIYAYVLGQFNAIQGYYSIVRRSKLLAKSIENQELRSRLGMNIFMKNVHNISFWI